MLENQLSRYGAMSRLIPDLAPGTKLFLVSDSDDTTVGPVNLGAEYPVDKDGVVRVFTTIQAAVNAASANRGDVIAVLPGYDQNLGGADSWNTAGVQIVGLGLGGLKGRIRFTATGSTIGLSANNIRVKNLRFSSGVAAIARGVSMDTGLSGQIFEDNTFDQDTVNTNWRVMLRLGSKHALVQNNRFLGTDCQDDSVSCGSGIRFVGGDADFAQVKGNFFYGQFDTTGDTSDGGAAIAHDTTNTADLILKGVLIQNNVIVQTDTAVAAAVRFSAGYTLKGIADANKIGVVGDSAATDTVVFALSGLRATSNRLSRSDTTEKLMHDSGVVGG